MTGNVAPSGGVRLVVGEAAIAPENALEDVFLLYGFDRTIAEAVARHDHPGGDSGEAFWAVPERWRPLRADFRQQVLNRPFADLLTRVRPVQVRIESITGCTLDLPRISVLLGIPVTVVLPPIPMLPEPGSRAAGWLRGTLESATLLELPDEMVSGTVAYREFTDREVHAYGRAPSVEPPERAGTGFDYALYEFILRDHPMLWRMQQDYVRFFESCSEVLDLGCGAGIFLGLLEEAGITGRGVERSGAIVRYARELGFDVRQSDALDFLEDHSEEFDGIYCSHFVEHLDITGVERLIGLLDRALKPGGKIVMVFPDPESIRSQLLGFWRDPEHVRFYHPDLIELIGRAHGLDCIWHSHRDGPAHRVVPFPARASVQRLFEQDSGPTTADPPRPLLGSGTPGPLRRLLARVGIARETRIPALEQRLAQAEASLQVQAQTLARLREAVRQLSNDTKVLWDVNQTWGWEDNAVLVMRKPPLPRR